MPSRDSHDLLIFEVPAGGLQPGHARDAQDALIFELPAGGINPGHLRDAQDCLIFEYPFVNGMFVYQAAGANVLTAFTPEFPPVRKQPLRLWGLEAKRTDSLTSDGLKTSVLDHLDTVTTLFFDSVAASDMAAWKAFETYALGGATFAYQPLPDYPGSTWDNTAFCAAQLLSMDWKPVFKSFGIFSLEMKLKLVAEL